MSTKSSSFQVNKKLLLIKARVNVSEGNQCVPPLGLLSLAAVAREQCGWDARLLNSFFFKNPEEEIRRCWDGCEPDVVGISAITAESSSMHQLASIAREAFPKALILAGGPHPSNYPDETLENPAIDSVVVGEGELTMKSLLDVCADGRDWKETRGLIYRSDGGELKRTAPQEFIMDLDSLPFPAWDLLGIDNYASKVGMPLLGTRRYMPIMTSRGCPFHCIYCHEIQGRNFRAHSSDYVLRLIRTLVEKYGITNFDIFDDIFNWDRKRMAEILDHIIEKGPSIRFTFPNGVRTDLLKEDEIDKLCRAGCEYVCLAIETASPRLQKYIKKNLNLENAMKGIKAFARRRVFTVGYFMLGFPTETEEEIMETIKYALRSPLHVAMFFTVSPFQGTKLHGIVKDRIGEEARNLTTNYLLQKCNISDVPDKKFFKLKGLAHIRFYSNPWRIFRILRDIPNRRGLISNIKGLIFKTATMLLGRLGVKSGSN